MFAGIYACLSAAAARLFPHSSPKKCLTPAGLQGKEKKREPNKHTAKAAASSQIFSSSSYLCFPARAHIKTRTIQTNDTLLFSWLADLV
jgi:hypothetical protein